MRDNNYTNNPVKREATEPNNDRSPVRSELQENRENAKPYAEEKARTTKFPKDGAITAKLLNVREKASTKSKVLATLEEGETVVVERTVNGDNEEFYKINASVTQNGRNTVIEGYIVSKFCKFE